MDTDYVFLPMKDGGIARRAIAHLSNDERSFVEQTKNWDRKQEKAREKYWALAEKLLFK